MRGYLIPSILWHLAEEGNASCQRLAELIGCYASAVKRPFAKLKEQQLVEPVGVSNRYRLTPKGKEVAFEIDPKDVEVAAP